MKMMKLLEEKATNKYSLKPRTLVSSNHSLSVNLLHSKKIKKLARIRDKAGKRRSNKRVEGEKEMTKLMGLQTTTMITLQMMTMREMMMKTVVMMIYLALISTVMLKTKRKKMMMAQIKNTQSLVKVMTNKRQLLTWEA